MRYSSPYLPRSPFLRHPRDPTLGSLFTLRHHEPCSSSRSSSFSCSSYSPLPRPVRRKRRPVLASDPSVTQPTHSIPEATESPREATSGPLAKLCCLPRRQRGRRDLGPILIEVIGRETKLQEGAAKERTQIFAVVLDPSADVHPSHEPPVPLAPAGSRHGSVKASIPPATSVHGHSTCAGPRPPICIFLSPTPGPRIGNEQCQTGTTISRPTPCSSL